MTYSVDLVELLPQPTLAITVETNPAGLGAVFERVYPALFAELGRQELAPSGPPYGRYHLFTPDGVTVEVGIPVDRVGSVGTTPSGEARPSELPGGEAAALYHVGPYEGLKAAHEALAAWLNTQGRAPRGGPWENYVVDPSRQPDPKRLRTRVLQALEPVRAQAPERA